LLTPARLATSSSVGTEFGMTMLGIEVALLNQSNRKLSCQPIAVL
jgi:hypothetical protein